MQKTQRTFTKEFELESVQLVKTSKKPLAQIARDLGIADRTLHYRRQLEASHGEQGFPGSGHQMAQEEDIRLLKREVETLRQERDILKSAGHLLVQPALSFPFIAEQHHDYPITVLCKTLEVSQSDYYAWKSREPIQHCREDARLCADIQQSFLEHRQVYDSPRIHAVLKARGIPCRRKRVVRLMQTLGLSAKTKKRRKSTTRSALCSQSSQSGGRGEFAQPEVGHRYQSRRNGRRLAVPGGDLGSVLVSCGWPGEGCDRR
jgi:transposase